MTFWEHDVALMFDNKIFISTEPFTLNFLTPKLYLKPKKSIFSKFYIGITSTRREFYGNFYHT